MSDLGPDVSTPIQNFECRARCLYHRLWMVIMDSFRCLILPDFFRIGVNVRRHFGRRPVNILQVSYRPFEELMVRVPHHDPEHGGSIFLTTLSLSKGQGRTSSEPPLDLPRGGEPVEPQSNSEPVESVEPIYGTNSSRARSDVHR